MPKIIADHAVYRATLTTLVERGYAGATTKLIAEAAGVNEGTLFRKYGSKPQLINAAIAECAFQLDPESIRYTGDVTADLTRAAEGYAQSIRNSSGLFPVIMSEMARYPELRPTVAAPHKVIREMAALITRYLDGGELVTDEDPLQAVACFLGPLIIIGMLQHASAEIAPAALDLARHVERFVRGRQP